MSSLGTKLRAAREAKGLTASQAGEATHIKVQVIEQLERDDFKKIAAPIYGKGFIKLYAQFLGLDPAPLIHEYVSKVVPSAPAREPGLHPDAIRGIAKTSQTPAEAAPKTGQEPPKEPGAQAWIGTIQKTVGSFGARVRNVGVSEVSWMRHSGKRLRWLSDLMSVQTLKYIGVGVGCFVVLVAVVSGVTRCNAWRHGRLPVEAYQVRDPLKLTHEPPAPYLELQSRR